MDIGDGLTVSLPATLLSVDARLRTLLAHEAEGLPDRVSVSLSHNPTLSTPSWV